jgi:hypothetical protein
MIDFGALAFVWVLLWMGVGLRVTPPPTSVPLTVVAAEVAIARDPLAAASALLADLERLQQ